MSVVELDSPAEVLARLNAIERDLAVRQNLYESVARGWYEAQREMRLEHAKAMIASGRSSVAAQKAEADMAAAGIEGLAYEAEYEALKAAIRVLETRGSILQSILRAQSHV